MDRERNDDFWSCTKMKLADAPLLIRPSRIHAPTEWTHHVLNHPVQDADQDTRCTVKVFLSTRYQSHVSTARPTCKAPVSICGGATEAFLGTPRALQQKNPPAERPTTNFAFLLLRCPLCARKSSFHARPYPAPAHHIRPRPAAACGVVRLLGVG